MNIKRTELLAPAGDLEKLKIAVLYGADAVYIGGEAYGLRAKAKNFDIDTMIKGYDAIKMKVEDLENKGYEITKKDKQITLSSNYVYFMYFSN